MTEEKHRETVPAGSLYEFVEEKLKGKSVVEYTRDRGIELSDEEKKVFNPREKVGVCVPNIKMSVYAKLGLLPETRQSLAGREYAP